MNKFYIIFSLSLLVLFASCQKESTTTTSPTMTLEIDGVAQTTSNFNMTNTLTHLEEFGKPGRRMDIRATVGGSNSFILSASVWDVQNPPTGGILVKSYDTNISGNNSTGPNQVCNPESGINFCDGALGTYLQGSTSYVSENVDGEPTGIVTITANDAANKTISGTFDFKVAEFGNSNAQPKRFTGSFSNLSYTVIN